MIIGILKNTQPDPRVATTPEIVMKYGELGMTVFMEKDAGKAAGFPDDSYIKAGAVIKKSRAEILEKADVLIALWAPPVNELSEAKNKKIIITGYAPTKEILKAVCKTGTTFLALENLPRLSRVQDMDILSSQNNLGGYKAALLAIDSLNRAVPLMMTSAGTVPAAKALVLGAGVAGLQAIATLKRMGAEVWASDVRAAAKEQVESLGARFVDVDDKANFENDAGYASQTSPEYLLKQKERLTEQLKKTDILITTAWTGNKKAPLLVNADMVQNMPLNAVIVDMAEGNVERPTKRPDIVFIQDKNLPARVAHSASRFFARNVYKFIEFYGGARFAYHPEDEIMKTTCLCFNGKITEKKEI